MMKRLSLLLLSAVLFCACQSTGGGMPEVDPLALLGTGADLYVAVPVQAHKELAAAVVRAQFPGATPEDTAAITERVSQLYAGVSLASRTAELVAAGKFPTVGIGTVMKEKNGWKKQHYVAISSRAARTAGYPNEFDFYQHTGIPYAVSFPSARMLVLAQDVRPVLERYAVRRGADDSAWVRWLSQGSQDILFYVVNPRPFLQAFLNTPVPLDCAALYGSLSVRADSRYAADLYLSLNHESAMPVVRAMVSLALGGQGVTVQQVDSRTLRLTGLVLTQEQVTDFFLGAS